MEDGFKERLRKFAESKGLTIKGLQDIAGLSNAHFANAKRITPRTASKLIAAFPDIDISWINDGVSQPNTSAVAVSKKVPLVPVVAMAGKLTEFEAQVNDYECEWVNAPVDDVQLAMRVSGDSMTPEYPSGSIVFISRINEGLFIEWGKAFVVDTENGILLKQVYPAESADCVKLHSLNYTMFPDFDCPKSAIRAMYIVKCALAPK